MKNKKNKTKIKKIYYSKNDDKLHVLHISQLYHSCFDFFCLETRLCRHKSEINCNVMITKICSCFACGGQTVGQTDGRNITPKVQPTKLLQSFNYESGNVYLRISGEFHCFKRFRPVKKTCGGLIRHKVSGPEVCCSDNGQGFTRQGLVSVWNFTPHVLSLQLYNPLQIKICIFTCSYSWTVG